MSESPPAITNPVTGVRIALPSDDAPEGSARVDLRPGAAGPPAHVHPETEERFTVASGTVTLVVDGRARALGPGTEVRVSPGTTHTFRNETDERARMRVRTVPANERLAAVVATLFGLAQEGAVDDRGRPRPLRAAAMAEAVGDEVRAAGVPAPVETALGRLLGPVARALGREAVEERFLEASYWTDRDW